MLPPLLLTLRYHDDAYFRRHVGAALRYAMERRYCRLPMPLIFYAPMLMLIFQMHAAASCR